METGGDCFLAAFNLVVDMAARNEKRVALCHGIVIGREGKPIVHAWVEQTGSGGTVVIDVSNGGNLRTTREAYYSSLKARDVVTYTPNQALANAADNHYGPWDEAHLRLADTG